MKPGLPGLTYFWEVLINLVYLRTDESRFKPKCLAGINCRFTNGSQ